MEDVRDYIWVAPLIAGILTLISFFTPAFYASQMGISEYNWMWGLSHVSISGYGSRTFFIPLEEPMQYTLPIFLTGIFTAIFILIGSIGFIAMANSIRKGIKKAKDSANAWIGMGILMIVGAIIYIIGIDITMMNYAEYQYLLLYPPPAILPPFWSVYNPGFAIIAPFLGAGISIVAGIASKIMKPREVILPMKNVRLLINMLLRTG